MKNKSLLEQESWFERPKKLKVGYYKRAEISLGWMCNNNCIFCLEQNMRTKYHKTEYFIKEYDSIIKDLKKFKKAGYNHLTFLGGEPTIRDDFIDIVAKSRELGFKTIMLTTNGRRLSIINYARKLVNAGLNEIGFSIHGHTKIIHEGLTRTPGSFEQSLKAINNINKIRCDFFTSTVITKLNYKYLLEMYKFIVLLKPKRIFFSFPNPYAIPDSYYNKVIPSYSESIPYIHRMLDDAEKSGIWTTVANIPLCLMKGKYRKFKDENYWQVKNIRRVIRKMPEHDIIDRNNLNKKKNPECKPCIYIKQCEGIWNQYKRIDKKEFIPILK